MPSIDRFKIVSTGKELKGLALTTGRKAEYRVKDSRSVSKLENWKADLKALRTVGWLGLGENEVVSFNLEGERNTQFVIAELQGWKNINF